MLHSREKNLLQLNKNNLQTIEFLQGHYITMKVLVIMQLHYKIEY